MQTKILTLSDSSLLAEFARQEEFKGFFEKRVEVPPDYMGLLMRDGQFVDAFKGAHLTINGMFSKLTGLIGGSHAVSLLIADLKTFAGVIQLSGVSKDHLEVKGTATIEMQINPERPQGILGLMEGRKALSKSAAVARITPHLSARVFEGAVARINGGEIRGNKGLQDMIQADLMKEVERIAGDLGLLVRNASVEFALNDVEKKAVARAAADRQQAETERDLASLKRQLEREQETTLIKIAHKHAIAKLDIANPAELERMVLANEIDFTDARNTGERLQEMKELQHQIEIIRTTRIAAVEEILAKAQLDQIDLNVINEKKRVIQRNTEMLDADHARALRALEREYGYETRERELGVRGKETAFDRGERGADAQFGRDEREKELDTRGVESRFGRDERERELGTRGKETDFGRDEREKELDTRRKEGRFGRDEREEDLGTKRKEDDYSFDRRTREVDVHRDEQKSEIELQAIRDREALEKLKGLAGLEASQERDRLERRIKEADSTHSREMERAKLNANTELDRMQLASKMTADQLKALMADKPGVANVLIEEAKARGADIAEREKLLREMVAMAQAQNVATAQQARDMFTTGVQGNVGVAAGVGGKPPPAAVAGMVPEAADGEIDCPKCGRHNKAKDRFCVGCGEQLRR